MLHIFQFLAALCAAMFAGAAIYINVAEQPARMLSNTAAAAVQWAPSYKRATYMQAPLAVISFLSGTSVWLLGANEWWLIASLLIGSVVPFTFIAIMPTNKRLLAPDRDFASTETRQLLERWGKLHAVRSVLSFAASVIFLWQASA